MFPCSFSQITCCYPTYPIGSHHPFPHVRIIKRLWGGPGIWIYYFSSWCNSNMWSRVSTFVITYSIWAVLNCLKSFSLENLPPWSLWSNPKSLLAVEWSTSSSAVPITSRAVNFTVLSVVTCHGHATKVAAVLFSEWVRFPFCASYECWLLFKWHTLGSTTLPSLFSGLSEGSCLGSQ